MFKALKKNIWKCGFLVQEVPFPYKMFIKSFQFFGTLLSSTRRDPSVQNIQKI
jgi:hypothetical protein